MTILFKPAAVALSVMGALSFSVQAQSILKSHDTYQALDISAERLEMKQKQGRAIFKGAVKVTQGKMTLSSDTLTVFYDTEKGIENPAISRLNAEGHVTLVSATESLSGDWGVYDVNRRVVTLGGNVTFTQNQNTLRGDRLEFDLVSGLAKLDGDAQKDADGRVKGRFNVPEKDPASDKKPDGRQ